MIPTAKDIEAMRRLRSIMEQADGPSQQQAKSTHSFLTEQQLNNHNIPVRSTGRPDVDAMADILNRFNNASANTAKTLVEDSRYDPRVREAISTTKTNDGLKIGEYRVTTTMLENSIGSSQKAYNVVDSNNNVLCENLTVSEAAHAVIRYLIKGLTLDHGKVQNILELEETFSRNRADAARFRYRYDRCIKLKENAAANVFADRFQVARANALSAHDQIKSILENIR